MSHQKGIKRQPEVNYNLKTERARRVDSSLTLSPRMQTKRQIQFLASAITVTISIITVPVNFKYLR
jgi:hypothetical protein